MGSVEKVLGCDGSTINAFKYLELGIYPIRFETMKRKLIFLQYILKEDKTFMIYQVLKATVQNLINYL